MLLIDDVHWADEYTVSVLTYLTDSVEELPLALVLSAGAEPLPLALDEFVQQLRDRSSAPGDVDLRQTMVAPAPSSIVEREGPPNTPRPVTQ